MLQHTGIHFISKALLQQLLKAFVLEPGITWNNMELTWKISQLNKNSYSTHQFFKQLRKFVLRAI